MIRETLAFTKGHGTENDFILLSDEEGTLDLSPDLVVALSDRRGGIGADGVLRVVRAGALEDGRAFPRRTWFMDYRNADGSTAEMCGNGIRVFAAYLEREFGVEVSRGVDIATRSGLKRVLGLGRGRYSVGMGAYSVPSGGVSDVEVAVSGVGTRPGVRIELGNPHTVVPLEPAELAVLSLEDAPDVLPRPPSGTNVEFVTLGGDSTGETGRIRMRVFERGVGETRSCGTGACAAAIAADLWAEGSSPMAWEVSVPGGALEVRLDGGEATLIGPAVLIADGQVDLTALTASRIPRQ